MHWTIAALLLLAGGAGGLINALAGGATLITFPAMLAAGLAPIAANASNGIDGGPGFAAAYPPAPTVSASC